MKRGDMVIVAAPGDYGKPRPAVVIQSDWLPPGHGSVILCQLTSTILPLPEIRVTIEPRADNGLRAQSQIMVDKPVTLSRDRIAAPIGRLNDEEMGRLDMALAFVMGLADR